jgi:hypothetical protein
MEHLEAYRVDAYTTVIELADCDQYEACCPLCGEIVNEEIEEECDSWLDDYKLCPHCGAGFIVEADFIDLTVTARAERPLDE